MSNKIAIQGELGAPHIAAENLFKEQKLKLVQLLRKLLNKLLMTQIIRY